MDDSCAVCAETLEWVAYGSCGHKDVCSTCVARLRFICDDRRCCICKTQSTLVFVTKALGDYTRMINDFSLFPSDLREGRVGGSYWYHEDTQALFDDLDHYKMIKEMCRLSCSVCDKMDDPSNSGSRRRPRFRNIEQLKGHLFHQHRTLMCSLCLEGRKVFICEQKLYTRAQLNQHVQTGDSEVDGTESERGGFMGHPICEFCRTPFYGDNELYSHMSTEHYTCHICQRQHPGQYEYYKNYDDLEIHFRREHFLCEDEACLAKKFIVFTSESELKRHNAMEHGGSMSRSKRNAALQIPTSFRYRRGSEQSNRRGRGRTFHRDYSEDQLPLAYEDSYDTANAAGATSSSRSQLLSDDNVDPLIEPLESLPMADSSRYLLAASSLSSRNAPLGDSSFPPLPVVAPAANQQTSKRKPEGLRNSMASHLRRQNNVNVGVSSSAQVRPSANHSPLVSSSPSSSSTGPINAKFSSNSFPELSSKLSLNGFPELSAGSGQNKTISNGGASTALPASYSGLAKAQAASVYDYSSMGSSSSIKTVNSGKIRHSTSDPNLASRAAIDTSSNSDFPPVSVAAQVRKIQASGQPLPEVEDVHTANKSLVERIRSALEFDEDKYTAFKEISGEYRQGMIDAETYLAYADQFGLLHLVLELARLCPDPERQKALVATYNANLRSNGTIENGWGTGNSHTKESSSRSPKKGKGKCLDAATDSLKDKFADGVINTVRKLQSSYKPSEEVAEVLSKDGYRTSKGSLKMSDEPLLQTSSPSQPANSVGGTNQNLGDAGGKGKKQKKTSKFHRVRLGEGSAAALLDLKNSDSDPDPDLNIGDTTASDVNRNTDGLPVRGAWRNGGGQRLVAITSKGPKK